MSNSLHGVRMMDGRRRKPADLAPLSTAEQGTGVCVWGGVGGVGWGGVVWLSLLPKNTEEKKKKSLFLNM